MRLGSMQHRKECGSETVGRGRRSDAGMGRMRRGYVERKVFVMFGPHLLESEFSEAKGSIPGRELTCVATDRRMGERLCHFYICSCLYRESI